MSVRGRADGTSMTPQNLVLVQGLRDTRSTIAEWNPHPWRVVGAWVLLSVVIAIGLLYSVYVVAKLVTPDFMSFGVPGIDRPARGLNDAAHILYRNSLVLALHAMVCVAVFIATRSLPQVAATMTARWRWIHDRAGQAAVAFVIGATLFSLLTQAYALGAGASTLAAYFGLRPSVLLITLLPHALPELTAVFLPLAACIIVSHRRDLHQLLAVTFVTVSVAFPVLIATSAVEVYLTPLLLARVAGS